MACLTPDAALSGDCDFLSANLCARSLFGEDALANLSIEKTEEGVIQGHVRIRSKTQGIALSLGTWFILPHRYSKSLTCFLLFSPQQVTRLPLLKRLLLLVQPFKHSRVPAVVVFLQNYPSKLQEANTLQKKVTLPKD